jgi:hypothetical protein
MAPKYHSESPYGSQLGQKLSQHKCIILLRWRRVNAINPVVLIHGRSQIILSSNCITTSLWTLEPVESQVF